MSKMGSKVARGIRAFVENPVTNLVKGVVLLVIGVEDVSHTFQDDLTHGHVRLGHGLIIIGFFGILDALPHLIDGLGAWAQYLELQQEKNPTSRESDRP